MDYIDEIIKQNGIARWVSQKLSKEKRLLDSRTRKDEVLNAYIRLKLINELANRLFEASGTNPDKEVRNEVLEDNYEPKARHFLERDFNKFSQDTIAKVLSKIKLQKKLSNNDKAEFDFIIKTSEFTKYLNPNNLKRSQIKTGVYQYCSACKAKITFKESHKVRINKIVQCYTCSKKCADMLRNRLKRKSPLGNKS